MEHHEATAQAPLRMAQDPRAEGLPYTFTPLEVRYPLGPILSRNQLAYICWALTLFPGTWNLDEQKKSGGIDARNERDTPPIQEVS